MRYERKDIDNGSLSDIYRRSLDMAEPAEP